MPPHEDHTQESADSFGGRPFSWRSGATWPQRVIGIAVLLILIGLAATLLVWGLIVGAIVVGVMALIVGARAAWQAIMHRNGSDTLRHNVRVVRRQ